MESLADLTVALNHLSSAEFVAFDIETDGVDEQTARVIGVSFSHAYDIAYYVPLMEWNEEVGELLSIHSGPVEAQIIADLCEALRTKKLIMHNGIFDIVVMESYYGWDLAPALYADTILMKHVLDEERPFGLKEIAVMYQAEIGIPKDEIANQEQLDLKDSVIAAGGKWTKTQKDMYKGAKLILARYAAADADLTLKLFDYFQFLLEEHGLIDFFYDEEVMPLYLHGTIPMKKAGLHIDVKYFKNLKLELESDIINLELEIFEELKPHIEIKVREILDKKVKTSATGEFAATALRFYDIPVPLNAKTGKPTLAKSFVKALAANYPDHPMIDFLTEGQALPVEDVYAIKREIFLKKNPDNPRIFNLSSGLHLGWLIFDHFGCEPKEVSRKTKKPKLDKNALEDFDHLPFIARLAKLKKSEKLLATYVNPILEKEHNGKLYPSFLQFGTTSGRFSCAGGLNFQTLPRDDKRIKAGFIAPPGYKIIAADYSALEPRIFAWVSEDEGLKIAFKAGLDLYSKIAIDVFGLDDVSADPDAPNYLKKKYPQKRDQTKIFALAVVYGANEYRIAKLMGLEPEEAKEIINRYLDAYPNLRKYMARQEREAYELGEVRTKFGRIRHLPEAARLFGIFGKKLLDKRKLKAAHGANPKSKDPQDVKRNEFVNDLYYKFRTLLNNAKNSPIQGTAAHVMNAAIIKLNKLFIQHEIDGWLALTVHDECVTIVREDQVELASKLLQKAMENNRITRQIDVPMVAQPVVGNNLSECK